MNCGLNQPALRRGQRRHRQRHRAVQSPGGGAGRRRRQAERLPRGRAQAHWAQDRPQAQTFETAAVSLEGVQSSTYYGTVSWCVRTDGDGNVTLDPLRVVSMGAPTGEFMSAAGHWNDQEVGVGGAATATDDLPLTAHRTVDPASLDDAGLEQRMRTLCGEITAMDRASPDYQNKRFEIRGLARERYYGVDHRQRQPAPRHLHLQR